MTWLIHFLIALPLFGALVSLLLPKEETRLHRGWGLFIATATFFVSLGLLTQSYATGLFQLETNVPWIASFGIHYHVGIDGISLWLLLLTTFLMPIVMLSTRKAIVQNVRELIICLLLLEAGMLGAFVALDLFLFYVCWELMLIPMYFLIGMWGGERRVYASIKFVIYTMVGSLLMLGCILYVAFKIHALTGQWSFDWQTFLNIAPTLLPREQLFCFVGFALAFFIKVPLFPLHTWLPDAHVEAPTAGSVLLAGVLLKFGVYGLMRFAIPFFPYAVTVCAPWICVLAVIGIVYGSLVAYAQTDIKKLIAYSSVAHMGLVVLGLFMFNGMSVSGAMYQMLAHGISTGGLFLCVGVLYERRHTRQMEDFGGVWQRMPVFGALFLVFTMASIGLPALCGFVGEFLILLGTMSGKASMSGPLGSWFAYGRIFCMVAASGVVLSAVYMLGMFQKVMLGPVRHKENETLTDLSGWERVVLLPMVVMAFWLGIYPAFFMKSMAPTLSRFVVDTHVALIKSDPTLLTGQSLPHTSPMRRSGLTNQVSGSRCKAERAPERSVQGYMSTGSAATTQQMPRAAIYETASRDRRIVMPSPGALP